MVVSGGRMKERNRFLAAEGFNVQLKKLVEEEEEEEEGGVGGGVGVGADILTVGVRRLKFSSLSNGFSGPDPDSFSSRCTVNGSSCSVDASSSLEQFRVTGEPTTHQKVRRIIEEHTERNSHQGSRTKLAFGPSSSSIVGNKSRELGNYSIVSSSCRSVDNVRKNRKDCSGGGFSSFSVCETPSVQRPVYRIAAGSNGRRRKSSRQDLFRSTALPSVSESPRIRTRQSGVRNLTLVQAKDARELPWGPASFEDRDGFLLGQQKRLLGKLPSAAFIQGNGRASPSRGSSVKTAQVSRENGTATGLPESYRTELRRSPSQTTIPTSIWKKPARIGVKKSVSFSSDTSFQEKRSLFNSKTHVHEAKVYHKGVLQDRASPLFEKLQDVVTSPIPRPPPTTTTTTPGVGPLALVRAARDGTNGTLRQMMARVKTPQGAREIDVNTVDASGRTAVSYLAGDGAVAMLEAALSFPEIDVNIPDNEGNTPLHFAAQAGHLECVSILLQRCSGIEVDARNTLGFTPLMKAAIQGRTKCAKILLFAGASPTLRDYGRGLRAEQWARFCGRYVCAEVIERFARHRLLERTTSCRWGSEPELAARVLQGKVTPLPTNLPPQPTGLRSKIRRVFRTSSGPDNRSFSLVSQLTSAALCASSPALPRPGEVPPVVKSLIRPLSVPQLRITLVPASEGSQNPTYRSGEKIHTNFTEKIVSEKIESSVSKPPRSKKKNK